MTETRKTYCSICSAFCGLEAEVDGNTIVKLRGDSDHPMSQGFTCSKGRHFHHLLTADNRLSHCQKKTPAGWETVTPEAALDNIGSRLQHIIEQHGPESVAIYCGNGITFKALGHPPIRAFLKGLGSHQLYTSLTIDQPAKIVAVGRHGVWAAGGHSFESARALMILGNNPLVSGLNARGSIPSWQPGALKKARAKGLKLIVVDPRRTETARQADLYLPIRPGTDAIFLSAIVHHILEQELHDSDFCVRFTEGLDELREQVAHWTLDRAAAITGLDADQIAEAAELFARAGRGTVSSGTGPDMAPHANLTEHLIYSLNSLCGRHNRAGERVNASLLTPDFPPMEAVVPWEFLPETVNHAANTRYSRVSGARQLAGEMPTATLTEEILTPGKGQIRALLVIGGNPLVSIPERDKTRAALETLELCVCIDGRESETAAYADYMLPANYGLERVDMTSFNDIFFDRPFHQVSDPVVQPPGDARYEYQWLAALAQRLGTPMPLPAGEIDTAQPPAPLALLNQIFPEGSTRVSIDEIARHPQGKIFTEFEQLEVLPAPEGMDARLRFMPDGVKQEFDALRADTRYREGHASPGYTGLVLTCRRNNHVYNSMCHQFPQANQENPAWLHPDDIAAAGFEPGQRVTIETANGKAEAQLAADDTLRRGVVSVSHGYAQGQGASVASLLKVDDTTDAWAHIPQMSAVPVILRKA